MVGALTPSTRAASYWPFGNRATSSFIGTWVNCMSTPTAASCRFTASDSRSYVAPSGTRHVNVNLIPDAFGFGKAADADAGVNSNRTEFDGKAQWWGQIGLADGSPNPPSASLINAARSTAVFNALLTP